MTENAPLEGLPAPLAGTPRTGGAWVSRIDRVVAICGREYSATVRTKTFIAALLLLPLLMLASLTMPLMANLIAASSAKRCAILDETGVLYERLEARLAREQAVQKARTHAGRDGRSSRQALADMVDSGPPPLVLERVEPSLDRPSQLLLLSDEVRRQRLFAFAVIDANMLDNPEAAALRYFTESPTYNPVRDWLISAIRDEVSRARLAQAGVDAERVLDAPAEAKLRAESLFERVASDIVQLPEPDPLREVVVPLGLCILMFISVMMCSSPLMQGVLEEKMNRIAEVLVSSVSPAQLLLGKLLGALCVSYTMLFIYLGTASLISMQLGVPYLLTGKALVTVVLAQGLAVLSYGSVFLAVGSACNDLKESQALLMPVMGLITAPLLLLQLVLADPNGSVASVASVLPFFSPVLLMLRVLLPPGPELWEVLVGVSVALVSVAVSLIAATRILRVGMLAQGGVPSYRRLLEWVIRG